MKTIKSYFRFINEDIFTADINTPDEIKNKITRVNTLDSWIKEFPTKKSQIAQIYNSYEDEVDKSNKLKPFMAEPGTKNSKFKNELLGLWAEVCSLNRQITDLDKDINKSKEDISEEEKNMKDSDGDAKANYEENIKTIKEKVTNSEERKNNLMEQILSKQKESEEQLDNFKKELEQFSKEIRYYNEQKLKKM
jgi:hypothetical protein